MNCWLSALNYTCSLALLLQSLQRGPRHLASSLQTVLKFRLPKADSKKPPFLSIITASDLLISLFRVLHVMLPLHLGTLQSQGILLVLGSPAMSLQ